MKLSNYIADHNRFKLAGPPKWWLSKLWAFDDSLVVVPSRQDCLYRLAQKRKLNLPDHITNEALFKESDTRMLAQYGLVPVTSILATANWSNPMLFEELRRRSPWRMGGADAVNKMLEEQELKEELDRKAKTDDTLDQLAKDSWGLYNKKIGVRSHMWSPTTKKRDLKSNSSNLNIQKEVQKSQVGGAIFLP